MSVYSTTAKTSIRKKKIRHDWGPQITKSISVDGLIWCQKQVTCDSTNRSLIGRRMQLSSRTFHSLLLWQTPVLIPTSLGLQAPSALSLTFPEPKISLKHVNSREKEIVFFFNNRKKHLDLNCIKCLNVWINTHRQ